MADVLVLNADGQPISYLPLSTVNWKEAITYMFVDKVHVLEWYDDWVVRSANWETKVPAVIMLKDMMRRKTKPRFSKQNLFLRDKFTCQYCSIRFPRQELTLDHVLPISKGGRTNWENIVAACGPCNHRKGNNERIRPATPPHIPTYWELVNNRKELDYDIKHPSWEQFI